VIDENMGDAIRVTVIAAGFDRWADATAPATTVAAPPQEAAPAAPIYESEEIDVFDDLSDPFEETPAPVQAGNDFDDLDVPSFLK
jgi:cell division protein FtsZ